jgi:hypothetical protein
MLRCQLSCRPLTLRLLLLQLLARPGYLLQQEVLTRQCKDI